MAEGAAGARSGEGSRAARRARQRVGGVGKAGGLTASCRWRGVMRFTRRSLEALPASSSTSAVRYSRMAAEYTAAVAPTRPLLVTRILRWRWIRPTGNCRPALDERETDFLAFSLAASPLTLDDMLTAQAARAEGVSRVAAHMAMMVLRQGARAKRRCLVVRSACARLGTARGRRLRRLALVREAAARRAGPQARLRSQVSRKPADISDLAIATPVSRDFPALQYTV